MTDAVPAELVESWRLGNVSVFIGAGASVGSGLPTWQGLVDLLMRELPEQPPVGDLPTLARYYELVHGRHRLVSVIAATLRIGTEPNDLHRSIASLQPRAILTTNFDDLIERALRDQRHPYGVVVSDDEVPFISAAICPLIKLHGTIERPASLVFTSRDYELYEERKPAMARLLASELQTKTLLLVGYSASDPDFRTVLSRIQEQSSPHSRRLFMLAFAPSKLEQLELASRGINVIDLGPLDHGTDPTTRASEWLGKLRRELGTADPARPPESEFVNGKVDRTKLVIDAVKGFLRDHDHNRFVVRLRQGYSSLSLSEEDHPAEPAYSELLRKERDAFLALLEAGADTRLIVGRRPVFSSDLTTGSPNDMVLALRLRNRCSRLIDLIRNSMSHERRRLVVVCASATHLADIALGTDVLLRGVRSDSSSGYSVTVISRSRGTVEQFNSTFDEELREISSIPGSVDISQLSKEERIAVNQVALTELARSLAILDDWLSAHGS